MERAEIAHAFTAARKTTESICKPLQTEDYVIQSMPDVSPPRWHLAHTTWFFETFVLQKYQAGFKPYDTAYGYFFNSYYDSIGPRTDRPARGLLSRPTVREIYAYRSAIDSAIGRLFESIDPKHWRDFRFLVELGINHEQQHQELLCTDIKHIFSINPLHPVYRPANGESEGDSSRLLSSRMIDFRGGLHEIGRRAEDGFSFDNETPRHKVYLNDFQLQNRLVTNGEYLEFMIDGGYSEPRLWLSDGWAVVLQERWTSPLYWVRLNDGWSLFTLSGLRPLNLNEPVCHVSYYEADAFARWAQKRLPTEAEWEVAATRELVSGPPDGNFLESQRLHPEANGKSQQALSQMFGDVWEWTSSAYLAYPGYRPLQGALGEYNGKFMSNQMVLRGGSCVTPRKHIRPTYRNFFQCDKRWQFSGFRLAGDAS